MAEPTYRQAIHASWKFTWHHKVIWIFGIFAAFLGQMGLLDFILQAFDSIVKFSLYPKWFLYIKLTGLTVAGGNTMPLGTLAAVLFTLFIIGALFIIIAFFGIVSQGTIIHSAGHAFSIGKKSVSPAQSWHASAKKFWPLFFIQVVKKIFILTLSLFIGWAAFNAVYYTSFLDSILFLIIFVLSITLGIVVSFLVIYAACYVVLEDKKFVEAVKAGWRLFTDHWLVSIEVGLIILLMNILVFLIAIFGLFIFFFPAVVANVFAMLIGGIQLYVIGMLISFISFTVFVVLIGSVFIVFSTSVWTYLFMKMHKKKVKSTIHKAIK